MSVPFIQLFKTSQACYLYDVNTDRSININKNIYNTLKGQRKGCGNIQSEINRLKAMGYLNDNRIEKSEHPITKLLPFMLQNKLRGLTLQVTQKCNLRCEYCIYSGKYKTRSHSHKEMSWDIAKSSIDYFIAHSSDSEFLAFGFYGGEPLLRYEFIRHCVQYIKDNIIGKKLVFNITTNGTIMSDEIAVFFCQNDFNITFSLDGPEFMHNFHRKYISGKGSFDDLMNNLLILKKIYREDFHTKVNFNTVIDVSREYEPLKQFINTDKKVKYNTFFFNTISNEYTDEPQALNESYFEGSQYQIFIAMLAKLKKIDFKYISKLTNNWFNDMQTRVVNHLNNNEMLGKTSHHSGPCAPGVKKLFVTTTGDLYPCERVSESSSLVKLGHINTGIDYKKADEILNIERKTHNNCKNCWAYLYCNACIKLFDQIDHFELDNNICQGIRNSVANTFLDYYVLSEVGYDFYADIANGFVAN